MLMFAVLLSKSLKSSVFGSPSRSSERGQATAEYALVILAAATIAGLVLAWAASTGKVSRLLNAVLDAVIGQVG